jgi:hypothetical protein
MNSSQPNPTTRTDALAMRVEKQQPSGFIALLNQVADIERMIVSGLTDEMPCKKKHIYREQAFRQAASLATTYFAPPPSSLSSARME